MTNIKWGTGDQFLSSGSNILITFWALYSLEIESFGLFTILYSSAVFLTSINRSLFCETLLVSQSANEDELNTRKHFSSSLYLSGIIVFVLLLLSFLFPQNKNIFICLSLTLPFLFYFDIARYHFLKIKEAKNAFFLDLVWFIASFSFLAFIAYFEIRNLYAIYLLWGLGAVIALIVFWLFFKRLALPCFSKQPLLPERLGVQFLMEATLVKGSNYLVILILSIVSGPTAVGALNTLVTLFSPIGLIFTAWTPLGIVEFKALIDRKISLRKVLVVINSILILAVIAWFLFLTFIPEYILSHILGDKLPHVSALIPLMFVFMLTQVFRTNAVILLKSMREGMLNLKLQFYASSLKTALSLVAIFISVKGLIISWVLVGIITSIGWIYVMAKLTDNRNNNP